MARGGSTFFYHQDGLGTVTELTDSAGVTAKSYAYDAWGNQIETTGTVENPYTYTGRELDAETGLYYYRARYYDPQIGRFLQKDPIGFKDALNLYLYVRANPASLVDPTGLTIEDIRNMTNLAKQLYSDLRVPDEVDVADLPGDSLGFANPFSPNRGITIDDRYLQQLTCNQIIELFEIIVHESIHRTRPRSDSILRPFKHPDIYEEAYKRTLLQLDKIEEFCNKCPVAPGPAIP
jgi:RHS repeat-associated protein